MKPSVGATALVVSAIVLALHSVNCAPNSEISKKGDRIAKYIQTTRDKSENAVKPVDSTSEVRQSNDYGNNVGDYNAGNHYNNAGNNYDHAGNNGGSNDNNVNKPELVPEDGNPENGVAAPPEKPPQQIGFAALVNSLWNLMLNFIRGALGIERRDPPRIARVLIRAAVSGKEDCWKMSACHAGRMMRGLPNSDIVFMVAERFTSGEYKKLVRRVRRAAEDNENCTLYECND